MTVKRSPIARLIAIGERVLDLAIDSGMCPLCFGRNGEHGVDCLVAEALRNDPVVRRRARAAKEGQRG